ncbi:MAG TPA: alpha/beta hydrolase [Streptosporangiaceae bacterium]|jgi:acetyl esterase|nr:alpha/beta hydrolase [Streptosporangiaceae bacterium]
MPLDPQFRTILDTLEAKGLLPLVRDDAEQTRAHYRTLSLSRRGSQFVPEPVASVADRLSPGGVPVRIFEPCQPRGGTVVYLHGGGWVVGDVETHDPLARRVANVTGARVVSVGYRLAPEHPFPAGLDDAEHVLRWVGEESPDEPVGVAGDSAGASLAAGLALRARDREIPLAAQLLFYPATDPTMSSKSSVDNAAGYFLTRDDMAWFYQQYLPAQADASEPEANLAYAEANLAYANVNRAAPAVVATAEFDPLRDDGAAYADRLKNAGVRTEYVPGPGLIHGYAAFLGVVDAADATATGAMETFGRLLHG